MQWHQLLLMNIILRFISGKKCVIDLFIGHEEVLLMSSIIYRGHTYYQETVLWHSSHMTFNMYDFIFVNLKQLIC